MKPSKKGNIEKVSIVKFLENLDLQVGSDIIVGDFDIIGWNTAVKFRSPDSEGYKKYGAIFRPNFERGILIHALIKKYGFANILEIGYGRGYVTCCASKALYEKVDEGSITSVDPDLTEERAAAFDKLMSDNLKRAVSVSLVRKTSDEFFKDLSPNTKFDLIFIDGDHRYEFVSRDFENSLKHIDQGYIIMDDYHLPSKKDDTDHIEVSNFVDSLEENVKRKLVLTDRVIFTDDRNTSIEDLDYGMVIFPIGGIENEQ